MAGEGRVKPEPWLRVASTYQVARFRDTEVLRVQLRRDLEPDDPEVSSALDSWPGRVYLHRGVEGAEAILVRAPEGADRPRWWLHLLLFLATLFTTHMAGALMVGVDPLATRIVEPFGVPLPLPSAVHWHALARGAPFALPFVAILLGHELGHYLMARRHRVSVTPPFFLPFPAYWSVVGTLGAFIRIKGPTVRRSVLFDIGAGGPLVSFALSIPVFLVGLGLSDRIPGYAGALTPFLLPFAGQEIWLGDGLAVHALTALRFPHLPAGLPLVLDPVAFAGWLGFFLTALNLLPMGQLDGGHVLYSLSGDLQHRIGRLFLWSLLPLGFLWWGWWIWGVAATLLNRGRMAHPPVLQEQVPLGRGRRILAWTCVVIFVLTFAPLPLRL